MRYLCTLVSHCVALVALVALSAPALADGLVDPMQPIGAPRQAAAKVDAPVRVSGIFVNGEHRVAVLDGRVVQAGDRVGDVLVQAVLADGVRIVRAGRTQVIRLPQAAAPVRREASPEAHQDSLAKE